MTILEERRYILTNLEGNNNKFWHVLLSASGTLETNWGRVGAKGQSKIFYHQTRDNFLSRCREKEHKGYREQKTIRGSGAAIVREQPVGALKTIALEEIKTTSEEANKLINSLVEWNVHQILAATTLTYDKKTGAFATPLGIIDLLAINQAREKLSEIEKHIRHCDWKSIQLTNNVNELLMLVPKDFGRTRRTAADLFPNLEAVKKENELLDMLEASLRQPVLQNDHLSGQQVFNVTLETVSQPSSNFRQIVQKFQNGKNHHHAARHLRIKQIYKIELAQMKQEFDSMSQKIGKIRQLWHGTSKSNLLSILQNGLRVSPPANAKITGKMFGNGIYFSDQSTKALNYSYGYWNSNSARDEQCFMFLADVAMGNHYTPHDNSFSGLPPGFDSTFAKAGVSGVHNNEMIVYQNSHCNLTHLVEFGK